MGIQEGRADVRREPTRVDREAAAPARRGACPPRGRAVGGARRRRARARRSGPTGADPREARAAAPPPRARRAARADGPKGERAQSEMALGILLADRPYLSELASRAD